jgi:sensor histidine kinase regulating citrate/malate metabolism
VDKSGKRGIIADEVRNVGEARAIFDSIGMAVLTVDDKGVISFANRKAEELFNPKHGPPPSRYFPVSFAGSSFLASFQNEI